ncbi:MAG: PASTA domain-containing protein, partial [Ruminococcus sp.]|nr:PASTA domain-containing protein [Ruminococcus sp.]
SITTRAARGDIISADGVSLATSTSVYTIILDPNYLDTQIKGFRKEWLDEKTGAYKIPEDYPLTSIDDIKPAVTKYLSEKLEIDYDIVESKINNTKSKYQELKTQVGKSIADEISAYVKSLKLDAVVTRESYKRIYPQSSLASTVIGYTNIDGEGLNGLEKYYDEKLIGVDGKTSYAVDGLGRQLPDSYSVKVPAQKGNSLHLTLNTDVQNVVEKYIKQMNDDYFIQNRCTAIAMNPKTGGIIAMATYPSYDLNNNAYNLGDLSVLTDPKAVAELQTLSPESEEYKKAYEKAYYGQQKNKAITELYMPGSVFKVITSSAAIEEGLVQPTGDSFNCSGSLTVADRQIHCWKSAGHGHQNFQEALTNSCNPAFMTIGARLGADKFFDYCRKFGLMEKTGIDLPGEVNSLFTKARGQVEVAVSAFGQTNAITPMQLITAYAACINGGNLVTPHLVDYITDYNDNVIYENPGTPRLQVISKQTSKAMQNALQTVVDTKPDSNASIIGYKVGGKSGTSPRNENGIVTNTYIASYCCFAPADDPEVVLLVIGDYPGDPDGRGYYGSVVAVPTARDIMTEILPLLDIYPTYTSEELEQINVSVPNVEKAELANAKSTLEGMGLTVNVVGNGNSVLKQSPSPNSMMSKQGTVQLYTELVGDLPTVSVPDLRGLSLNNANDRLASAGLNFIISGLYPTTSTTVVESQSIAAGEIAAKGAVVEITFRSTDLVHD